MQNLGIQDLIKIMVARKASDLHLRVPSPPVLRIDGSLVTLNDLPPITPEYAEQIFASITTPAQRETFSDVLEVDFAYSVPGMARLRVNALRQRGTISIAFRLVLFSVPSIDEFELPQLLKELVLTPRGLILITGHTGSGKSTTLAAMVDHLNRSERRNIVTVEDPIEFLYRNEKSIIAQRDLGDDTKSFSGALKHVLRHDPDVIVVGEMRDLDTIATAITASETGHLVMGTLHTSDAAQTINRIIDMFPPNQQHQITLQLSQTLVAVISQTLLPRIAGGRVAAFEILMATSAVRNLIREDKVFQLPGVMQLGTKDGMRTLDQSLADLVKGNVVSRDKAMLKSSNPEQLTKLLRNAQGAATLQ